MGPGDFFLPDPLVGLAELSSHRASLTLSFDGTDGGQARRWSRTSVLVANRDDRSGVLTVEGSGEIAAADPSWSAEQGGAAYRLDSDGQCSASVIDRAGSGLEEPAASLSGLIGGEAAGPERVGDIDADAFAFDERALGLSGDAPSTGRVWIATTGGFVVKYEVSTEGGEGYFGTGISGTLTTRYEVTDVNGSVRIDLPSDCPPGLIVAPLPSDAADIVSMPGSLRFTTNSDVSHVAAFYEGKASGAGWKSAGSPVITATAAFLEYTDGDLFVEVFATTGAARSNVEIVSSRK